LNTSRAHILQLLAVGVFAVSAASPNSRRATAEPAPSVETSAAPSEVESAAASAWMPPSLEGAANHSVEPIESAARTTSSTNAGDRPPPEPPRPSASPHHRIYSVVVMGDSLSDPKSFGGRYLDTLRDKCPKSHFESRAKGGNMVNQMRHRFAHDVFGEGDTDGPPRPRYTHVLILGGIADIGSNVNGNRSIDKIESDLTLMYRMAHEHGAEVIALTLPPWGGFVDYKPENDVMMSELNAWIKKRPPGVDLVLDVYPLLSCGDPNELCPKYGVKDRLHWNQAAHDIVGAALYEHIFKDCD
jgi:GDSL-like Lipase/Acylhydrolase family